MFVVRRSFRNYNQMLLPGSIVDPASIKRFKTRLKDRYIIEVTAHNFNMWKAYFKNKYEVALTDASEEALEKFGQATDKTLEPDKQAAPDTAAEPHIQAAPAIVREPNKRAVLVTAKNV